MRARMLRRGGGGKGGDLMAVVLVGLNHRTAPVDLREKLALSGCGLPMALQDLQSLPEPGMREAVILSTCNRLEIYAEVREAERGRDLLASFVCRLQDIPRETVAPHLYSMDGEDAIRHLMRVACGLDSMILGEAEILGQVGDAVEEARKLGVAGPVLARLFGQAVHAGRRARSETAIGRHTTSVGHAAVQRLLEALGGARGRRVLVVGAGEMAEMAAGALRHAGISEVAFINRTFIAAEALAAEHGGRAFPWHQLADALEWCDGIVAATGAPHLVLSRDDVEATCRARAGRPLVVVDIAVPRDVDDGAAEVPGVRLFDIDDLQSVVDANLRLRQECVPAVEAIVAEETARMVEWLGGREVAPVIRDLEGRARSIAEEELRSALNRLDGADERTREVLAQLAHRIVSRLLHEPRTRLRDHAAAGDAPAYSDALRELFGLAAEPRP